MEAIRATEANFDEKLLELSSAIDDFEGYTHAHGLRIAAIADSIGKYFNLAAHDRFFMQQAALLHDVGEMVMGRDYIKQNRPLSASERLDMQRHPVIGEQEASKLGYSRGVQLLIRWHHEWWNGSGYPDALEGEQIPLAARILRVADSFAALRDDRPRRRSMSVNDAKEYLIDWTGIEFDPRVVQAFFACDYIELEVEKTAMHDKPAAPQEKEVLDLPQVTTSRSGLFPVNSPPQLETAPTEEQPRYRFSDND